MYQQLVPVNRQRHQGAFYRRSQDLGFAREQMAVELSAEELPKAVASLPLALMDIERQPRVVALLSVLSERNHFITPGGRWNGGYLPALFRIYPFALRYREREDGSSSPILCVDEQALVDEPQAGEALFDEGGQMSAALERVRDFLTRFEADRRKTRQACQQLADAGVVEPWELSVNLEGRSQTVRGI